MYFPGANMIVLAQVQHGDILMMRVWSSVVQQLFVFSRLPRSSIHSTRVNHPSETIFANGRWWESLHKIVHKRLSRPGIHLPTPGNNNES